MRLLASCAEERSEIELVRSIDRRLVGVKSEGTFLQARDRRVWEQALKGRFSVAGDL